MKKIILLLIFILSAPVFAGDPHHNPETVVNNYPINKTVETNGLAALYAADQIHHSQNTSGLQLGFGVSRYKDITGFAAGAALNVNGWGLFNWSIAKEPDIDPVIGIGINLSLKP